MSYNIKSVVTLNKKSGVPADAVQNTFSFISTAASDLLLLADLTAIETALADFYNTVGAGGHAIYEYMAASLSLTANANTITHYNVTAHLNGTPHGSPVRAPATWTLAGAGGSSEPDEVAACMSFHSNYTTDVEFGTGTRPRARDRGRVYVGPLAQSAVALVSITNEPIVLTALRTAIADAGARMIANAATQWATWSRTNASMAAVEAGWVDNAFDTQRRRGNKATARSTF